jgi:hypothetical protein
MARSLQISAARSPGCRDEQHCFAVIADQCGACCSSRRRWRLKGPTGNLCARQKFSAGLLMIDAVALNRISPSYTERRYGGDHEIDCDVPDRHSCKLTSGSNLSHPSEVLSNPILSGPEKRCVLAAWASDAFAMEDNPWHRQLPGSDTPIPLKAIMEALRRLDEDGGGPP